MGDRQRLHRYDQFEYPAWSSVSARQRQRDLSLPFRPIHGSRRGEVASHPSLRNEHLYERDGKFGQRRLVTVAEFIFRKQSSFQNPGPAKAFVFIDNHPGNTAGGSFSVVQPGSGWNWGHFPGARHQNGANLSFADGHVEHWRWKEAKSLYWEKHNVLGR